MRTLLFGFLVCVSFSSCISAKYYNTYYVNLNKISKEKFKPTKSLTTYDYNENNLQYFNQNGYVLIGYNSIRSTYIDRQEAINTGCWIGASVMLYKYQYVGTASGTAVVPFYNPGDTYTVNSRSSGSVSVYGTGGSAYGSYNSNSTTTITTPGSFSYYSVPYSNDYYDQYTAFFVKKYYRVPEQNVALFQKPNSSSSEIMVVKQNEWFEVVSKANKDFYKVIYEGNTGYISASNQFK